jgi:DNA-binding CsgD family transcriptional regulator
MTHEDRCLRVGVRCLEFVLEKSSSPGCPEQSRVGQHLVKVAFDLQQKRFTGGGREDVPADAAKRFHRHQAGAGARTRHRGVAPLPFASDNQSVKPLVVVEGSGRAYEAALRDLAGGDAFTGPVRNAGDAAEALLAAIGGSGVVVHALAERDVIDRLVDDLRRLGPVDHRAGKEPASPPSLTPDERRLLDALARGKTLGDAAMELHLSRRTADRRLAAARAKLGVATTAEAVVAFVATS